MKRTFAIAAVAALSAGGFAVPAFAADGVSAAYGCRSITFTNKTGGAVSFNYGTNNSDDPGTTITVPAGATQKVTLSQTEASFIGWSAKAANGTVLQARPSWGTDLNKLCGSDAGTSPATNTSRDLTWSYGCGTLTVTNKSDREMQVSTEGTKHLLAPGKSQTYKVDQSQWKDFDWSATFGGLQLAPGEAEQEGVDLTKYCTKGKSPSGGLARTGF